MYLLQYNLRCCVVIGNILNISTLSPWIPIFLLFLIAGQYVGAPFGQDLVVSSKLFVLSPNNKVPVPCGH